MEIERTLHHFIQTTFLRGDGAGLADDASLIESGLLDSTDQLELVLFLESEFDLTVGEDEASAENLDTIERIRDFIVRKRAGPSPRAPVPEDKASATRG